MSRMDRVFVAVLLPVVPLSQFMHNAQCSCCFNLVHRLMSSSLDRRDVSRRDRVREKGYLKKTQQISDLILSPHSSSHRNKAYFRRSIVSNRQRSATNLLNCIAVGRVWCVPCTIYYFVHALCSTKPNSNWFWM